MIENKCTATDIYCIEDMFEQIKIIENKLDQLFTEGHNSYDKVMQELVCLVNIHELLKEKVQVYGQFIKSRFSLRLREARVRLNKLLERTEKAGIKVKTHDLKRIV